MVAELELVIMLLLRKNLSALLQAIPVSSPDLCLYNEVVHVASDLC